MAYLVLSSVRGTTIGLTSGDLIENISIGIGASKLNSNFGNVKEVLSTGVFGDVPLRWFIVNP